MFINNSSIIENCIQWPSLPTKNGHIVYVHPGNLKDFVKELDRISVRFVLVSCGSDYPIPFGLYEESKTILYSDKVICWFSQNAIKTFSKLRHLPIGIDYHTDKSKSKEEQEEMLIRQVSKSKQNKIYGNFQFNLDIMFAHDRNEALEQIPPSLIDYEESRIPREECYKKMASYKFIASPLGNGMDCHRTWEALALGCIPIMKHSCMDSMFEGLPILFVDSWSDITQELLDRFEFDNKNQQLEKLNVEFWLDEIKKVAQSNLLVSKEEIDNALSISYEFDIKDTYSDFSDESY